MPGVVLAATVGVAAAVGATAGHAFGGQSSSGTVSPFGGPVPVHIAHVGRIDVDVGPAGGALRRVRCAAARGGAVTCFVAR